MKKLSEEAIEERLTGLEGWKRSGKAILKTFSFETFLEGIDFINQVARIAEEIDHHPDISVHYRRVTFTLWTHAVDGLTDRDFSLAGRIDEAYRLFSRGES
jgi:4a-hydroxytetrahydrobiopterin dehydratase